MLAPILLFTYNRPIHTQKTVECLLKNDLAKDSDLFVFSDAPKTKKDEAAVAQVRELINNITGFKSITIKYREENVGLANSIISGVNLAIQEHKKVIVVEDDLETSPFFLKYMNDALDYYSEWKSVFSISGYSYPPSLLKIPASYKPDVYCSPRHSSWGWATWADRWDKVDWSMSYYKEFISNPEKIKAFNKAGKDMSIMLRHQYEGKISSWSVRFSYAHFVNHAVSICPVTSYVSNIGADGTGNHYKVNLEKKFFCNVLLAKEHIAFLDCLYEDESVMKPFRQFFRPLPLYKRGVNRLGRKICGKTIFFK